MISTFALHATSQWFDGDSEILGKNPSAPMQESRLRSSDD